MTVAEAQRSVDEASVEATEPADRPMERWISHVLRAGVLTSAAVILGGVALFLSDGPGPGEPHTRGELTAGGGHAVATSIGRILTSVGHRHPLDLVRAGLLILILTPLLRVAMTCALFVRQRDWIFVAITAAVLSILVVGLIGIGA